jgi:predicted nuclease of predicted toxin-antitoxin system
MSLLDDMARTVDGEPGPAISWPELSRYLREEVWNNRENIERKDKAATRQRFYAGKGDGEMADMVASVFQDPEVIKLRLEWIKHAKFNNVLRRAVHELATVYSQPATRSVEGDENNANYQEMQRRTRMHEVMQRVNRLAYLHRAVFVYPRIRMNASGKLEPVLEVVTPDRFDPITHPADPTLLLGISIDLATKSVHQLQRLPSRIVLTAHETIEVDSEGQFIESTLKPHDLGRLPGVFFAVDPASGTLFDPSATDDLESAHRAVWFENILLLKESKSATRTTVVQGDVSVTARQQADDSERALHLQDGATASTLDRSMDLKMFRDASRDVYQTAAANHGIPPTVIDHSGTQSAEARDLIRAPLKELRMSQQVPLRDVERDLAGVQSAVYSPIDECQFTTDGWNVDFADPNTPLGQKESLEVFKSEREAGLTSTVAEMLRRNPDLSREQAKAIILIFGQDELWRQENVLQKLSAVQGSMGAAVPGTANPQAGVPQGPVAMRGMDDDPYSWVEEMANAA